MSEWISVKDRLPERIEYWKRYIVIVLCKESCIEKMVTTARYDGEQKIWCVDLGNSLEWLNALIDVEDVPLKTDYVTHWMPLPELPKENKTK